MAATITVLSKRYEASIEYGLLRIRVPGADVLSLGTAIDIITAPTGDKYIEPLQASGAVTYSSGVPSITNTTLWFIHDTATTPVMLEEGILLSTAAWNYKNFIPQMGSSTTIQIPINKKLQLKVAGGNPGNGGSDLYINLSYRILSNP